MKQESFKINIPEGMEIDKEKSTFEEIFFKKKKSLLIPELCDGNYNCNYLFHYQYPLGEERENIEILIRLISLRNEVWRRDNDWKPNWKLPVMYMISCSEYDIIVDTCCFTSKLFVFRTEEIRDEFLEKYKFLLEKCKGYY